MRPFTIVLVALLALTGCATQYQPSGFSGGFSETQLAPDLVRVSFAGNPKTAPERAQDFALLRAAELAQTAGYSYLAILDERDTSTTGQLITPTTSTTYATGPGTFNTYSSGGLALPITKPKSTILVRFLPTKPAAGTALEAAFLIDSIRSKYRLAKS